MRERGDLWEIFQDSPLSWRQVTQVTCFESWSKSLADASIQRDSGSQFEGSGIKPRLMNSQSVTLPLLQDTFNPWASWLTDSALVTLWERQTSQPWNIKAAGVCGCVEKITLTSTTLSHKHFILTFLSSRGECPAFMRVVCVPYWTLYSFFLLFLPTSLSPFAVFLIFFFKAKRGPAPPPPHPPIAPAAAIWLNTVWIKENEKLHDTAYLMNGTLY